MVILFNSMLLLNDLPQFGHVLLTLIMSSEGDGIP